MPDDDPEVVGQIVVPRGMSDLLDDWMWSSPDAASWTPELIDGADERIRGFDCYWVPTRDRLDLERPRLSDLDSERFATFRLRYVTGIPPEPGSTPWDTYLGSIWLLGPVSGDRSHASEASGEVGDQRRDR